MSALGKSLGERTYRWYHFATQTRKDLTELPHLAGDLEDLERMYREATALVAEVNRLRAETALATRKLRVLAREGDMLRTRMAAGVRSRYGLDAARLIAYGLKPRPPRPRKDGLDRPTEIEARPAPPQAKPPEEEPE